MNATFVILATVIFVASVASDLAGNPFAGLIIALLGCGLCIGEIYNRDRGRRP